MTFKTPMKDMQWNMWRLDANTVDAWERHAVFSALVRNYSPGYIIHAEMEAKESRSAMAFGPQKPVMLNEHRTSPYETEPSP